GEWTKVSTGSATSPRYVKTTIDIAGRTAFEERPGYSGATILTTNYYNDSDTGYSQYVPHGALAKTTRTVNGTALIAPTLYEYNNRGDQTRSGLDLGGNSVLDDNDTYADRINGALTYYIKDPATSGTWWQVSESTVYVDGSATPVTTSKQRRQLTNVPS